MLVGELAWIPARARARRTVPATAGSV